MDFQQEFIEEVKQILKNLEHSLMQLEKNPNHPDEINNVYRYLHTLKGSAGMFGFQMVEKLCHDLEFIYSDIREGLRQQDDTILDLTLHAVDVLSDLIDKEENADKAAESLMASIKQLQDGDTGDASSAGGGSERTESFVVFATPDQHIFKRGINIQAVIEEIQELGETEIIIHNETVPFEKQLQEKNLVSWLEILISTNKGEEAIKDVFMFMKQTEYAIFPVTGKDVFTSEEFKKQLELTESDINERFEKLANWNPDLNQNSSESSEEVSQLDTNSTPAESAVEVRKSRKQSSQISVSTPKLDQLINIVSELVTFRSELQHIVQGGHQGGRVEEAMEKLEFLTLKLRDSAFNIRLVPLNILQVKMQRLVRSISQDLGKEVEFFTDGLDTELDRSMIYSLEAPLMHLIRNAIDHGIEAPEVREKRNKPRNGLLKLFSYNSGDHVFIQIQDDGNGIDFEKVKAKGIEKGLISQGQTYSEKELIQMMMEPGFSTADKVTTVSGRGVGMDVVKKEINAIRGDIEVSTEKGLGTIFTLRLPLTLTILDTLVVNVSGSKYLIPISEVEYCYEENHKTLYGKKSRQVNFKGQLTPFVSLREFFGEETHPDEEIVIIVNKNDSRIAVVVDKIEGQLQTVYKPLNDLLQGMECFSGASILGDGTTALLLNALKLKN